MRHASYDSSQAPQEHTYRESVKLQLNRIERKVADVNGRVKALVHLFELADLSIASRLSYRAIIDA